MSLCLLSPYHDGQQKYALRLLEMTAPKRVVADTLEKSSVVAFALFLLYFHYGL